MVPAPLLGRRGLLLGEGGPEAEMGIGHGAAPGFQPPRPQIPQQPPPRIPSFPGLVLLRPLGLQPLQGRHRQRGTLAQQPPRARSKSPDAKPCRYNRGRSSPTSLVRRLNNGRTRLTSRSASLRTHSCCTVIVPQGRASFRGLPYPLRYSSGASTATRRCDFARPSRIVTASPHSRWRSCWMWPRTKSSRWSHRCLDSTLVPLRCSITAVPPFLSCPGLGQWVWSPERLPPL